MMKKSETSLLPVLLWEDSERFVHYDTGEGNDPFNPGSHRS